jgi:hypothetical protein
MPKPKQTENQWILFSREYGGIVSAQHPTWSHRQVRSKVQDDWKEPNIRESYEERAKTTREHRARQLRAWDTFVALRDITSYPTCMSTFSNDELLEMSTLLLTLDKKITDCLAEETQAFSLKFLYVSQVEGTYTTTQVTLRRPLDIIRELFPGYDLGRTQETYDTGYNCSLADGLENASKSKVASLFGLSVSGFYGRLGEMDEIDHANLLDGCGTDPIDMYCLIVEILQHTTYCPQNGSIKTSRKYLKATLDKHMREMCPEEGNRRFEIVGNDVYVLEASLGFDGPFSMWIEFPDTILKNSLVKLYPNHAPYHLLGDREFSIWIEFPAVGGSRKTVE